jgi:hypothetical protein
MRGKIKTANELGAAGTFCRLADRSPSNFTGAYADPLGEVRSPGRTTGPRRARELVERPMLGRGNLKKGRNSSLRVFGIARPGRGQPASLSFLDRFRPIMPASARIAQRRES